MKDDKLPAPQAILTIRDIVVILVIIAPFTFIDGRTALFAGAIGTSLIFIRGVIRYFKPRQINGHAALPVDEKLPVPKGVEVFELAGDTPMDTLYRYIAVLHVMEIRPRILIIRCRKISQIQSYEAHALKRVMSILSGKKTQIFFSEMNESVKDQFEKLVPDVKTSGWSFFYTIDDAIQRAEILLNVQ